MVIVPEVVIRPMAIPALNQSALSGPAVMPLGTLPKPHPPGVQTGPGSGMAYSMMVPAVVIRPILLPLPSVNHNAPSGPAVMPAGELFAVGTGYSVITPAVVIRPILPPFSVNQSAPSGPAVIPVGPLFGVGKGYSVKLPDVVTRPILLPLSSVNHSAPSGPAVISSGSSLRPVGSGY